MGAPDGKDRQTPARTLLRIDAKSAAWAVLCAALVLSWQGLTVRFNYGGHWSALYCTGANFRIPPALAGENIYRLKQSYGWDGQFYHYIAHDPFLADRMWKYIDNPRLRYRRILVPGLAYVLAWGNAGHIDTAYRAVILLFFGLGAYWLSRLAGLHGVGRAWGLAFVCVPAAIASMDRMAVDVALAAFVMAFALYSREGQEDWKLYAVLLLGALVRDTGLLLVAAYCIWLLLRKRLRRAAIFGSAALPALAWYKYIDARLPPFVAPRPIGLPFSGLVDRLLHPLPYLFSPLVDSVVKGFDYLAVAGILLAFAIAFPLARKTGFNPRGWAMVLFVLLGVLLRRDQWLEVSDIGRVLSPLLILLALEPPVLKREARFDWLPLAPLCMVAPRCALQLAPQVLGVLGITAWGRP
jgi:hypothetical protein